MDTFAMKRFLLALALLLAPSGAWAQCNGVFSANTLCGNNTGSPGIPGQFPTSALSGFAAGSTGQFQVNGGSGTFAAVSQNGILTNTRTSKTANYSALTADCGSTLALGGSAFFTLTLTAASGYGTTCAFVVVNEDTTRGKTLAI